MQLGTKLRGQCWHFWKVKIIESDEARTRGLGERGRVLSRPERWFAAIDRLADTWMYTIKILGYHWQPLPFHRVQWMFLQNPVPSYCVTRAPLLYFIRSWVALSFKVVSEWVSQWGIGNTCPNLHFLQYIKAWMSSTDPVSSRTPGIVKGNKSLKISHLVWFEWGSQWWGILKHFPQSRCILISHWSREK